MLIVSSAGSALELPGKGIPMETEENRVNETEGPSRENDGKWSEIAAPGSSQKKMSLFRKIDSPARALLQVMDGASQSVASSSNSIVVKLVCCSSRQYLLLHEIGDGCFSRLALSFLESPEFDL